jgi:hypothetical protein
MGRAELRVPSLLTLKKAMHWSFWQMIVENYIVFDAGIGIDTPAGRE